MSRDPQSWTEVGDRVFVRRYASFDLSVGVVAGEAGLLLLDTRCSSTQGHELAAHVRALSPLPVTAVVNTHVHFDHTFGNGAFPGVRLLAHETVPLDLPANEVRIKAAYRDDEDDEMRDEVLATEVVAPTDTFASARVVDLGGRFVELVHPGRGHTRGDIVALVPDANVLFAGDLVESSGPPSVGDDAFPDEWPDTLEIVASMLGPSTVVVPGHGPVVDRSFVLGQRLDLLPEA